MTYTDQVRALRDFLDRTGGPPEGIHPVYYELVFAAARRMTVNAERDKARKRKEMITHGQATK